MVNLITRMTKVWGLCRYSVESDTFNGKICLEIVFMEKRRKIELLDNSHINFALKSL